jgi:hypothetical protein
MIASTAYPKASFLSLIVSSIVSVISGDSKRPPPRFIESSDWNLAPDSTAEQVIEAFQEGMDYSYYRNKNDFFPPEFKYHPVEPTNPDTDWVVYREADNGDLLCIGGVRIECVRAEVHVCSACGARNPEPGHSCSVDHS